ncbi:hypothetical protein ACKA04_08480 [Helcococcus kunzii]
MEIFRVEWILRKHESIVVKQCFRAMESGKARIVVEKNISV